MGFTKDIDLSVIIAEHFRKPGTGGKINDLEIYMDKIQMSRV